MTQPVDPVQENSLPPIPLPPQPAAYAPVLQPQPGLSVPPTAYPGQPNLQQPNPQQPYLGYPSQQPYQAAPPVAPQPAPQYAIPAAPAGPGPLELDFWLPKTKLLALVALVVPPAVSLLHLIFSFFGYFSAVGLLNSLFGVAEALVIGVVMMFSVLGIGRLLENKNKTE